jgi:SRSO17 transposase
MEARYEVRKRELLAECRVAPEVFEQVLPRLERFMEPFVGVFYRQEPCQHAAIYVSGLLSDLERKNVESIAYRFGQERLPLQRFIGWAPWDDVPLRMELARQVGQHLGEEDGVLVFDPSGFPKSGSESVGVARQWCGALGKTDNCQVAVYMGYASRKEHALVDTRLYLPKEWTGDKARLEKAGVPKDQRRHRTRHRLCLEMLKEKGPLLPHSWIAGDDEMGRPYWFRRRLDRWGEQYLLAVPSNTLIRDLDTDPPAYCGRGRQPKRPWQRVDKWTAAIDGEAWTEIDVRDGEKGPLVVEMVKRRVVARTPRRQEGHQEVLVVIRSRDREDQSVANVDYYLSNAAREVPLEEFGRVAKAEHRIEECIQRSKSEAGLDQYEVRNWTGWYHHQTLSLIATWFLVTETRRGKKLDTIDHVAADSARHRVDPPQRLPLRHDDPYLARARNASRTQPTRSLLPLETT